jgi:hypothetical protein
VWAATQPIGTGASEPGISPHITTEIHDDSDARSFVKSTTNLDVTN